MLICDACRQPFIHEDRRLTGHETRRVNDNVSVELFLQIKGKTQTFDICPSCLRSMCITAAAEASNRLSSLVAEYAEAAERKADNENAEAENTEAI